MERCLAQSEHSVFASCDLLQLEILKGHRQLGEHKDAQIQRIRSQGHTDPTSAHRQNMQVPIQGKPTGGLCGRAHLVWPWLSYFSLTAAKGMKLLCTFK